MICKRCGEENPDAKRVCTKCGAFLEGYTFNNVTGDYGYRGADGEWYKTEEDYRARCQAAEQSPIDHAKLQLQILLREEIAKAMDEKVSPLVSQMTKIMTDVFQAGFDTGLSCGKFVNYNKEE